MRAEGTGTWGHGRGVGRRGGGISSYIPSRNFNLHHMTRDWRLIKHDNGGGFIVNPWRLALG